MQKTGAQETLGLDDAGPLRAETLRDLALGFGAGDAGFVAVADPALSAQAGDAECLLPGAQAFVSLVTDMNPANVRSPSLAVANNEFHFVNERADRVAVELAAALGREGIRATAVPAGFPMDVHLWPGKMWALAHKPIAEAAGMGRMGFGRNLLHPRFGTFTILSTVIIDKPVDRYGERLKKSPCIRCKACARACPTGAIGEDGAFQFINCANHNYRYRLGGFVDWVDSIASGTKRYRRRFSDAETVAMWQSLSCGSLYTCCNCMGACPAGEQHVGAYQTDREGYEREVVQPLLQRGDKIFVLPGSDAETRAAQLFPPERVKRIGAGVKPPSARSFLEALHVVFQPGKAEGVQATYHFVFSGADPVSGTVRIDGRELTVSPGLEGQPDLTVAARGEDWVSVLGGDLHPVWAVVSGKMKLKGKKAKMKDFMRCFPL